MSDYFSVSLHKMLALRLVRASIFKINYSNPQQVHKVGYGMLCM